MWGRLVDGGSVQRDRLRRCVPGGTQGVDGVAVWGRAQVGVGTVGGEPGDLAGVELHAEDRGAATKVRDEEDRGGIRSPDRRCGPKVEVGGEVATGPGGQLDQPQGGVVGAIRRTGGFPDADHPAPVRRHRGGGVVGAGRGGQHSARLGGDVDGDQVGCPVEQGAGQPGGDHRAPVRSQGELGVVQGPARHRGQVDELRRPVGRLRDDARQLGPREPRLHATAVDPAELASVVAEPTDRSAELVDLTPVPGRALDNAEFALTPDGRTVVTTWLTGALLDRAPDLVAIDVTTKARRVLATAPRTHHAAPAVSPDGRWVVCVRETAGTPDRADDTTLWLVELATGAGRNPTPDLDLGPTAPVWAADSTAVFFVADLGGRAPVFRVQLDTGEVTRLTTDGAYTDLCPAPDGRTVYALRSTWDTPPQAVALDATAVDQPAPQLLPTPGLPLDVPGSLTEVLAIADDGAPVRSWLILPPGASADSPAPLLVWIHGGPMHSWSTWSWRWNPHLLAARGYAVLLPDPALSTGYGRAFVQRGWGSWGQAPYTDLLAAVDAAEARPDIDASRTAAMGGSFGGYMANWVAGHTDRFRCIVTHASIWALEQFHGTTDNAAYWEYQFGDPYVDDSRYVENSPNRHLGAIRTPMLVIHGENDDRVPVGESLRLYTDLKRHQVDARLLLFPDEHHWVLRPGNSRVWYQTVFAFVDHYVLGKEWARPDLL